MSPSVVLLLDASQIVSPLPGSRLDGNKNGNRAKPADRIVAVMVAALAANAAKYFRRAVSVIVAAAATNATSGAIQNAGCAAAKPANQLFCRTTCLSNGLDAASVPLALASA